MNTLFAIILLAGGAVVLVSRWRSAQKKKQLLQEKQALPFPAAWHAILLKEVRFYAQLDADDKQLFEKRVQLFLNTKTIKAIDTEIDDTVRLLVAASAIIPTFAFPGYNYPHVDTILIYPNSFDRQFQTERFDGHEQFITGMVGNMALNGTVILSRPDLVHGFKGSSDGANVGIHEFVHLLDKEDGAVDGVPEILMERAFVAPWLREVKKEINKIKTGHSDINPYALTNNAEFLAVVSEYFFDNPTQFKKRHPDLYQMLSTMFVTDIGTATK